LPAGAKIGFYERNGVRIRYAEVGSGLPLLATPGGGLNSRLVNWPNAVINIPADLQNDFRIITMDQRNATNGKSAGPKSRWRRSRRTCTTSIVRGPISFTA
jgi:pimeloyl-ACP methyl ester carboxylesterase